MVVLYCMVGGDYTYDGRKPPLPPAYLFSVYLILSVPPVFAPSYVKVQGVAGFEEAYTSNVFVFVAVTVVGLPGLPLLLLAPPVMVLLGLPLLLL